MPHNNPLGTEKIGTLILKFSVPAIIGMVVSATYNIVDRIYIGNAPDLGPNGLAGITVSFPLMLIQLAIGVLFGIGGATLFAIRLGQKKPHEAEAVLGNAFVLLCGTALIYMAFGQLFLTQILALFGASETVLPYAADYLRVIFLGSIFQIVSLGLNHFIRADGSPRIAMMTMFLGAGINIVLDPIFIYGFGWGMAGAAWATILAQAVSALWVVRYFIGKRSHHKLLAMNLRLNPILVRQITALGLPGFLLQLASSVLNTVLNKSLLTYGGDLAISGMGVINSVQTFLIMPVIGLNQGVQPIVSFNFGAHQLRRVRHTIVLAMGIATAIVGIGYLITRFFPSFLVALFNREAALMAFTVPALGTWFHLLPLVGFQILGANFFQAIGRYKTAMMLTLTRQVLILIPAVLILPMFFGLQGILYAAPLADGLAAIVTLGIFLKTLRELEKIPPKVNDGIEMELSSE
jgi:putative MATE family efflux protein